jgi:hypothetical protein
VGGSTRIPLRAPQVLSLDRPWWLKAQPQHAVHRGTFGSVKDINAKIRTYIDGWNVLLSRVTLRVYRDRGPD